jgi:hypothetical protein
MSGIKYHLVLIVKFKVKKFPLRLAYRHGNHPEQSINS